MHGRGKSAQEVINLIKGESGTQAVLLLRGGQRHSLPPSKLPPETQICATRSHHPNPAPAQSPRVALSAQSPRLPSPLQAQQHPLNSKAPLDVSQSGPSAFARQVLTCFNEPALVPDANILPAVSKAVQSPRIDLDRYEKYASYVEVQEVDCRKHGSAAPTMASERIQSAGGREPVVETRAAQASPPEPGQHAWREDRGLRQQPPETQPPQESRATRVGNGQLRQLEEEDENEAVRDPTFYIAKFKYQARQPDELSFAAGERLAKISPATDEGWIVAFSLVSGSHGLVPLTHIVVRQL